jgi:hypothetical protein
MTYLDRLRALKSEKGPPPHTDKTDKTPTGIGYGSFDGAGGTPFSEISSSLRRALCALESTCPELVPEDRWRRCVEDGRRFLAVWADRAEALGWTPRDLFGLMPVPRHAKPSFNRLARYDEIGLIWLLAGREVVALTEATAAIQSSTGALTIYRRHNKLALGPVGDTLEGLEPPVGGAPYEGNSNA